MAAARCRPDAPERRRGWLERSDTPRAIGRRVPVSSLVPRAGTSGRFEAGQQGEVVGDHRGPDVGLEVAEPAPGAARQTVGPLEARDIGLDAGAEVP